MECPECRGDVIQNGEAICSECGLVVDETNIDHGPEWRDFTGEKNTRAGAPITEKMHDRGLGTHIGDIDFNSETRTQQKRMKKWHTWMRTSGSGEGSLMKGMNEIQRMASALGVPDTTTDIACRLFRQIVKGGYLSGRCIEGVTGACLFLSCKMNNIPRTSEEIAHVARGVERWRIHRDRQHIINKLDLAVKPTDPREHLHRFVWDIETIPDEKKQEIENTSRKLLDKFIEEIEGHSGKSPSGIAAASVYAAAMMCGISNKITQAQLADISSRSEVTIRNRYQEIVERVGAIQ